MKQLFGPVDATVRAAEGLADIAVLEEAPTKRVVNAVVDQVADHLGNTRAICRNSHVHPIGRRPAGLLDSERRALRLLR